MVLADHHPGVSVRLGVGGEVTDHCPGISVRWGVGGEITDHHPSVSVRWGAGGEVRASSSHCPLDFAERKEFMKAEGTRALSPCWLFCSLCPLVQC